MEGEGGVVVLVHSYSRQQDGKELLICSITSVRSVLVSSGGASRSSAAGTAHKKNRHSEINAWPFTKTQLQEKILAVASNYQWENNSVEQVCQYVTLAK